MTADPSNDARLCPQHAPTTVETQLVYAGQAGGCCFEVTLACGCNVADDSTTGTWLQSEHTCASGPLCAYWYDPSSHPEDLGRLNQGRPERWKPVPGYGGAYEVSDLGRVRS